MTSIEGEDRRGESQRSQRGSQIMDSEKKRSLQEELLDPNAVWSRLMELTVARYRDSESLIEQYYHGESPSEARNWALARQELDKLDLEEKCRRLTVLLDSLSLALAMLVTENNGRLLRMMREERSGRG